MDAAGSGSPWFCKWICPAGTLEGGVPLVFANPVLQSTIGFLYGWKVSILVVTIVLSIILYRPFCKYICPLGAIYALFNKVALYRYTLDEKKCSKCGACDQACPMNISPRDEINHFECVRCGKCKEICTRGALSCGFALKQQKNGSDVRTAVK